MPVSWWLVGSCVSMVAASVLQVQRYTDKGARNIAIFNIIFMTIIGTLDVAALLKWPC